MGYDTPRSLGDRETGGGLSLPVWISFMETALRGVPVTEVAAPEGVVNSGGEWFYDEYTHGSGVSNLGLDDRGAKGSAPGASATQELPPADERKRILDLFKN
jgi:penicillin-binding protein 1A